MLKIVYKTPYIWSRIKLGGGVKTQPFIGWEDKFQLWKLPLQQFVGRMQQQIICYKTGGGIIANLQNELYNL